MSVADRPAARLSSPPAALVVRGRHSRRGCGRGSGAAALIREVSNRPSLPLQPVLSDYDLPLLPHVGIWVNGRTSWILVLYQSRFPQLL